MVGIWLPNIGEEVFDASHIRAPYLSCDKCRYVEVASYPTGPSMYKPCLGGYPNLGSNSWNSLSKESWLPGGVMVFFQPYLRWDDDPSWFVLYSSNFVEKTPELWLCDYCYKSIDNSWFGLKYELAGSMSYQNGQPKPVAPHQGGLLKEKMKKHLKFEAAHLEVSPSGSASWIAALGGLIGLWEISIWRLLSMRFL